MAGDEILNKKKKMCIIDHYFHQKTNSFDFLYKILGDNYDVVNYWDYSPQNGPNVDIEIINNFEYVFFFQVINPIRELNKIIAKIIWMPMYDGMEFNDAYWYRLSLLPIKVVCFSKKLYNYVKKFNIECIYLQYFIEPKKNLLNPDFGKKKIFFWYRGNIKPTTIMHLISEWEIDTFEIMNVPDPGFEPFSTAELNKFNCKFVLHDSFKSKQEFHDIIERNNIFIAPRIQEGIGMSFLEALSMGRIIIAFDDSTMNEYIVDKVTGFLFNTNVNKKLSNNVSLEFVHKNCVEMASNGWSNWNQSIPFLLDFIKHTTINKKKRSILLIKYFIKYLYIDIFYKMRFYYKNKLKRLFK